MQRTDTLLTTRTPRRQPAVRPPRLAIVIPVRDEEASIGATLRRLLATDLRDVELVVIDDGSRDRSAQIARQLGARVLSHESSRGYGAALKTGIRATTAPSIAIMDGDGTLLPEDLHRLHAAQPHGGIAIGVRREPMRVRRVLKALFCLQVRVLTGARVPDLNSGLRVFDRRLVERLWPLLPDRFSFTTTTTLGAIALAAPVRFLPIHYARRTGGRSKFVLPDLLRFARTVARGCSWIRRGGIEAALPASAASPARRRPAPRTEGRPDQPTTTGERAAAIALEVSAQP